MVVEGALPMKDPLEVLRMKEQELLRVEKEIEALQITAELLEKNLLLPATGPETKSASLSRTPRTR
jgi:hypothetical protein